MAIKNCLGLNSLKLKELLKENIEEKIAENIISSLLSNDSEDIVKCDILCDSPVLEFFKEFSLFTTLKEFQKINIADSSNGSYDPSKLFSSLNNSLSSYQSEFTDLLKNGKGSDLTDTVNKYGDGSAYPSIDTLGTKGKNAILSALDTTNFYSDNFGNRPLNSFNSLILDADNSNTLNSRNGITNFDPTNSNESSGKGGLLSGSLSDNELNDRNTNSLGGVSDNLFSKSNTSFLKNIPNTVLESINLDKEYFKCFEPEFNLSNYITKTAVYTAPIITAEKIANIKRMHYEILMPIFRYYFPDTNSSPFCSMKIIFGITSLGTVIRNIYGSIASKHLSGECVDFIINGKESTDIADDIKNRRINIEFGTMCITSGVHITLPYEINGYEVKGLVITAQNQDKSFITTEFV